MTRVPQSRLFLRRIILPGLLLLSLLLAGCQEVFTYSLFEGLQRDPSDLPPEQQISYAQSALAAGDVEAMADIYDEIVALAADDPDLYLLAADLAMGASGITGVISDVLSDPAAFDYTTDLASVDLVMLANVAANVLAAETAGVAGITDEQYVTAAGAEILQFLEGGGDLTLVDWTNSTTAAVSGSEIENAYNFLVSAGQDPATFDDVFTG
jgi:hypothetical protein